ncbi:Uncharacterised protein [Clostridium paraputrificum]|nr:Uncharacterised protein [Clostridium paraputrificum]
MSRYALLITHFLAVVTVVVVVVVLPSLSVEVSFLVSVSTTTAFAPLSANAFADKKLEFNAVSKFALVYPESDVPITLLIS